MKIIIKPAEPIDVDEISRIAADTFALACPSESDKQMLSTYVAKNINARCFQMAIADPARRVLVAWVEEGICGFAVLSTDNAISVDEAVELEKIYVSRAYHGSPVASELMRAVFKEAEAMGAIAIVLQVYSGNERAKRFYRKFGFTEKGSVNFFMGSEVHSDMVMMAPLK